MSALTNEDKRSIVYFLEEKGDLTKWVELQEKKNIIKQELPRLVDALAEFRQAEYRLKIELEQLKDSIDD